LVEIRTTSLARLELHAGLDLDAVLSAQVCSSGREVNPDITGRLLQGDEPESLQPHEMAVEAQQVIRFHIRGWRTHPRVGLLGVMQQYVEVCRRELQLRRGLSLTTHDVCSSVSDGFHTASYGEGGGYPLVRCKRPIIYSPVWFVKVFLYATRRMVVIIPGCPD